MGLKTWMVLLWILLFDKGVSVVVNCNGIKNITVISGETFILDMKEDGVKENTLLDGSGNDVARIEKGNLTISDSRYKDNLTSKGFSFHIKSTAIGSKENFTASVLYTNGSHCSQHYIVTVQGDQICSETKEITCKSHDDYFTLYFDVHGVEEITWLFGSNRTIAITKDKAKLQILHRDFEGKLSVFQTSLIKYNPAIEDDGKYTAIVSFRNGTQCLQHYVVTVHQGFQYSTIVFIIFALVIVSFGLLYMHKTQNNYRKRT